jgi:hypothetical protein
VVTDPRLLMICPSRGRPENIARLYEAWRTTTSRHTTLLVAVDFDDPDLDAYMDGHEVAYSGHLAGSAVPRFEMFKGSRLRLGGTLNDLAVPPWFENYDAVGFLGDDHVPRTLRWDLRFLDELERLGTGIVYGNDLIHGAALPTAVAMTADITATLGYMVPAGLIHMWIDNVWKAWGEGIGRLSYLPDVVIEHVHPLVGKAPTDDLYAETGALMGPDGERWDDYRIMGGLAADIEKLQHLIRTKENQR